MKNHASASASKQQKKVSIENKLHIGKINYDSEEVFRLRYNKVSTLKFQIFQK